MNIISFPRDRNSVGSRGDYNGSVSSCSPESAADLKLRDLADIEAKALDLQLTVQNLGT